ncbi:Rho type ras-related small GTPase [Aspergillus caelatus]|uniref:Rho type ras-related small GTPase n=1 Tax=Aspergillus caelatus TaxID=61420 RepID=A0A5N6ZVD1_9EURO|nr:Rho type ras-related small GTPase [Aspergillus caelatus]KAE8361338.1 Rho type ras-related small GTPase [Aspergillus caelatus]
MPEKQPEAILKRKLVIIGDGTCGKTSLLNAFSLGYFPAAPTVFENYVTTCIVSGKYIELGLWDTAGQEDYERLRPLAYLNTHVILIGFAVDAPDSLKNAEQKWAQEAKEQCPGVPIILIGLKKDLRENHSTVQDMVKRSLNFVTPEQGAESCKQVGAIKYLECSSLTGEGVDDVFEVATRAAKIMFKKHKRGCCAIL